mgnify:CR=1 FL=1
MSEAVDCDYSIQGSGPALFLTHGIGAAKNAWRFLLPELSKHFTVVTYDLRGHGNSPVTNKNFSLDDLVLDLEKIREKTKIDKAHFAGHSLGGMIAPAYAIKFPNRVLSVGLLSTVAGRSDVDKNNVLKIISEMEKTGVEQTLQKLTTRWFTDEFIEENPDLVKTRLKQVIDTDPEVFLNVFKIYANTEMITWLKNISKPCLLMTGENDLGSTVDMSKRLSEVINNSQLKVIKDGKHLCGIECADDVNMAIKNFIEQNE